MALLSVQIKKHGGKVLVVTNGRQALRLVPMEKNVEYVINCLGKNTTKVRNIKSLKMRQIKNCTNHFEIKLNLTLLKTGIILGL